MLTIFTRHPNSIGESYWQHFKFALTYGLALIGTGMILLLHGLFPFLFEDTASNMIKNIFYRFDRRNTNTL